MNIINIIFLIIAIGLSFYFYKKNFIKYGIKLPTNLRIFIEVLSAFIINSFIYILFITFLMVPIMGILIKMGAPLTIGMFLPFIFLIINVVLYYFILKIIISKNPDVKDKAGKIASNITGTVFGLMILIGFILNIIISFIALS